MPPSRKGEMAELVEGAPLLREYGVKSSIAGSNPALSANLKTRTSSRSVFLSSSGMDLNTRWHDKRFDKFAESEFERHEAAARRAEYKDVRSSPSLSASF